MKKYIPLLFLFSILLSLPIHAEESPQLDPDAVWENIANIQGSIENLQSETSQLNANYEFIQSEYESLQEIVSSMEVENQSISEKLQETNELIKYLITMLEENRATDVQGFEDYQYLLNNLAEESTEKITSAVSGNTLALQEMAQGQESIKTVISDGLSDVSGNTLQVSGDLTDNNTLIICFAMVVVIGLGFITGMNIMRRIR